MASSVKHEREDHDDHDDHDEAEHHTDDSEEFYERTSKKYDKEDQADADAEDEMDSDDDTDEKDDEGAGGGEDDENAEAEDDSDTTDHAKSDTSDDDRDGDDTESDKESDDKDDADHTEDEEDDKSKESDDADDADDAEGGEDDEKDEEKDEDNDDDDDEPSDDLKAAANRHDIPLTVEDIKDPTARKVVREKIRNMDVAYTRAMQEARGFRKEQAQSRAEERYRTENPELVIVELLQSGTKKDPEFINKVQTRLDKLADADQAEAFKIIVDGKRKDALKATSADLSKAEQLQERADIVVSEAQKLARKTGLPWRLAERAIVAALMQKPEDKRDLTSREIRETIEEEAEEYTREVRAIRREESKNRVKSRSDGRRKVAPSASRAGGEARSPRPGTKKGKEVDQTSEVARVDAIMGTARRIFPGRKEK